ILLAIFSVEVFLQDYLECTVDSTTTLQKPTTLSKPRSEKQQAKKKIIMRK
ncbi:26320_t:CDS:2, partial [Racocetra persica]